MIAVLNGDGGEGYDMTLRMLATLMSFQLFAVASALAQTTPPGVTAIPEVRTGQAYWLWIAVAAVLIAMGAWYFASRRRRR
jgi:LPXTG-motif cell wall-anchored protein